MATKEMLKSHCRPQHSLLQLRGGINAEEVLQELTLLASDIKLNGQGRHPLDFPMTPMLRAAAREARPRSPSPPVHPSASRSVALSTPASPARGREGGREIQGSQTGHFTMGKPSQFASGYDDDPCSGLT